MCTYNTVFVRMIQFHLHEQCEPHVAPAAGDTAGLVAAGWALPLLAGTGPSSSSIPTPCATGGDYDGVRLANPALTAPPPLPPTAASPPSSVDGGFVRCLFLEQFFLLGIVVGFSQQRLFVERHFRMRTTLLPTEGSVTWQSFLRR